MRCRPLPTETYLERPFAGPAAAKSLNGTAGLKPEPSIYYSRFNALAYRDGDSSR
jgi:hypothetical protein